MPKHKTLDQAYDSCLADGFIEDKEQIDESKIKTMLQLSDTMLEVAQQIVKDLENDSPKWSIVFTMHYDALRELADILVRLDNKKIANHQCLFAYLCKHKSQLELDWDFFEKIRTKRNGINYYGTLVSKADWKEIELQTNLYLKTLRKAVEDKI